MQWDDEEFSGLVGQGQPVLKNDGLRQLGWLDINPIFMGKQNMATKPPIRIHTKHPVRRAFAASESRHGWNTSAEQRATLRWFSRARATPGTLFLDKRPLDPQKLCPSDPQRPAVIQWNTSLMKGHHATRIKQKKRLGSIEFAEGSMKQLMSIRRGDRGWFTIVWPTLHGAFHKRANPHSWMVFGNGKIPSRNLWELGVPLWLRKPPHWMNINARFVWLYPLGNIEMASTVTQELTWFRTSADNPQNLS